MILVFCCCLALKAVVAADEKVDPGKVRVSLTPEVTTVMLKAPTWFSFTIHNDADRDLLVQLGGDNRNALGRPNTFKIAVTDPDGKLVAQPDAGGDFGGISWMHKIPARGKHDVKLYLPRWATFETAGKYSISVKRTLKVIYGPVEGALSDDQLAAIDVKAAGQIQVTPYNDKKMGKLIDKLGTKLFKPNSDASEAAMRDLSNIRDERVIPYFIKGIETKRYSIQFGSLRALGQYDDENAFAALKRGMQLSADDVENVTKRKVANQLAINLRHVCAVALSSASHPDAIPFLLTRRTDPSEAVRITILHVLGKMEPAEALPILREMAKDNVERVSNEAKRYIKVLSKK